MKNNRCVDDYMMNEGQMSPIYECPCERIENREIHHEVRHIKPVHTRIINHHI